MAFLFRTFLTASFIWEGDWFVAITNLAGEIDVVMMVPMTITVDGTTFTGFWMDEAYSGTISDDGLSVSGTWFGPGGSGPFTMYALGLTQFHGNIHVEGEVYGLCGSRDTPDFPSHCRRE